MKSVITFIDGQNLYHTVKETWPEYHWPNYCPILLSDKMCSLEPNRELKQVRIYTGVPSIQQNAHWHQFWTNKLRALKLKDPNSFIYKGTINQYDNEKGIDVRLAIDIIKMTFEMSFDVGIIFSQDRDLNEAVIMAYQIAKSQGRYISLESAYPSDINSNNNRGLAKTQCRKIDKNTYDQCIDYTDYRDKTNPNLHLPGL